MEVAAVSNEEIVEQIQQGVEVSANQERLWNKNRSYVIWCIRKYIGDCPKQDLEDYVNEGFIGLMTAAGKYKAGQGANFITYATYHIRAALYRYTGMNTYAVKVPEYLKTRMRRLAVFKQEYREEFHREPEQEEILKALDISVRSLRHLEKTMLTMSTKSLDEYVSDDGDTKLMDMLSTDERIDELAGGSEYQKELHEELEAALSILDDKTALLMRCVYYQKNSYAKTAEIFSCSTQSVYERINKGFYKILHSKHRERLEGFMWEGYHVKPTRLSDYVDMEEIDDMGSEFLL
jgi:RNA polymerase sigma-B factor